MLLYFRQNYETPLHLAAFSGHIKVVQALLASGADPLAKDKVRAADVLNHDPATPVLSSCVNALSHTFLCAAACVLQSGHTAADNASSGSAAHASILTLLKQQQQQPQHERQDAPTGAP